MERVVLDTDVSSLSLKRRLPPQVLARLVGKQPCVTFVTVGELTQWAELRQWGRRNRDALERWLDTVIVLPYTEDFAQAWGRISAAAIRRGRLARQPQHYSQATLPQAKRAGHRRNGHCVPVAGLRRLRWR